MSRAWLGPIQELATELTLQSAERLAERLIAHEKPVGVDETALRHQLESLIHTERRYGQVRRLLVAMIQSGVRSAEVGYALLAAAQMRDSERKRNTVELLWTGPETHVIPVRRNDRGLLEVIKSAQETLHIVTFALFPVKAIQDALTQALQRGVDIHLFIEFPQVDKRKNKTSNNTIKSIGLETALRCRVYEWPLAMRHKTIYKTKTGKTREWIATLHAKVAVSDGNRMFVSSANLTNQAMRHNMELGLLIRNSDAPSLVQKHLEALIEQRVFVEKSAEEIRSAIGLIDK